MEPITKESVIYPGFEISTDGTVRNLKTGRALKQQMKNGYKLVHIGKKTVTIHRLMALEFLSKPDGCDVVNHIDGDKTNNSLGNLEWTTQKANVIHSVASGLYSPYTRSVLQFSLENTFIREFESMTEAALVTGCHRRAIDKCCKGENKTAKGFVWRMKHDNTLCDISEARPINEFPQYLINPSGNVFSLRTKRSLKLQVNASGYTWVQLSCNHTKKNYYIHQLVATHFIDNPHRKPYVNHKDGIKTNNEISNLEWVTHSENILHYYEKLRKN